MFEALIEEAEKQILTQRIEKLGAKGKEVLGMKACFEQSHFATPKTSVKMYERNPRFSSTCAKKMSAAIEAMRSFWREYRRRLEEFRKGDRAKFPAGTGSMALRLNLVCSNLGNADPHVPHYQPYLI